MTREMLPVAWMQRVCTRSVPDVLALYDENAVLIPTYDKSDLPGAGTGVLVGKYNIAGYFQRFLAKPSLCGTVDSIIVQQLSGVKIYSGLYTFRWHGGTARARYTFVVTTSGKSTHHSSQAP